jgi:hypothetical protein
MLGTADLSISGSMAGSMDLAVALGRVPQQCRLGGS